MLEKIIKLIEATEGLTINIKMGKDGEIKINGNFTDIIQLLAKVSKLESDVSKKKYKADKMKAELERLENEIEDYET